MNYITVQEASKKWGVTERMVRYYCNNNLVPNACQEGKSWKIPANATKPSKDAGVKSSVELPPLASKLVSQQKKKNYHGLYDYTILNLTYSSCRMASCRLTRGQVEDIITTGKTQASFEPLKISDLVEARNHVECVDYLIRNIMDPLTPKFIKDIHKMLFSGTIDEKRYLVTAGAYRKDNSAPTGRQLPPATEISAQITRLINEYEKKKDIGLTDILDFHVQFERLAPFDDGNGRVGRLILFKECLRHGVMPFILDDKRRTRYLQGLREWEKDSLILMEVVSKAQQRYSAQIELQKLKAGELRFQRMYARNQG